MREELDFNRLTQISTILGLEVPIPQEEEIPAEVIEALKQAREHMQAIPDVLHDLREAERRFILLDRSIDRLAALTAEAAHMRDDDRNRIDREEELKALASVVAEIAGCPGYVGPGISVRTRAHAKAAHRIVSLLKPVKETLAAQLSEQKRFLVDAIGETLNFLEVVARAYPETASITPITDLLRRVKWDVGGSRDDIQVGTVPVMSLH
jgi:hypothetical protein